MTVGSTDDLRAKIREIPDFPKPGILFYDITTLLKDPAAFKDVIDRMAADVDGEQVDLVVGMESRGFIFAAPLAYQLGAGFVPVRKLGKLPAETIEVEYDLEYGTATLEVHRDAIRPGQRVLIVDDLLATGGTVIGTIELVKRLGGEIAGLSFMVELTALHGRDKLEGFAIHTLLDVLSGARRSDGGKAMAVAPKPGLHARPISDRDEIAAYLRTDRRYAAYALGDLDGPNRNRCSWGIAYDDLGRPRALAMHQEGLIPQPLYLMGEPDGCREVLASVIKPRDAYFLGTDQIDPSLATLYELEPPVRLLRMVVDATTFQPFAGPAERLKPMDVEELNRLYQLGFRGGFPPSILEDGIYYGVRVRGRLISAAGTHVINAREGIGVVGNVMTHVDFRGHDFAKMVTSAVTAELLERVEDVALNVHADNDPAVAAYRRLGYGEHCRLTERLGRRRAGGWGLMRPIREAIRLPWQRDQR